MRETASVDNKPARIARSIGNKGLRRLTTPSVDPTGRKAATKPPGRPRTRGEFELTAAEIRLRRMVVEDAMRDADIARELRLSRGAVKQRIHLIVEKCGAKSRLDLAVKYWKEKRG
jgi:DNA-binding NarL/FixJ family response regulator